MKKMSRQLILFLTVIAICFVSSFYAGCDFNVGFNEPEKNWFVDPSDGKTKYVLTDINETDLLVGMTETVRVSLSEDSETADFSRRLIVEWKSENEKVASVDEDGVITAVSVGTTNVVASIPGANAIKKKVAVNVLKKKLTGIKISDARRTFLLGSEFKANFTLTAIFNGKFTEIVEPSAVDFSAVKTDTEGEYDVKVYYDYDGVKAVAHYTVRVSDSFSYEPRYLDYTYSDLAKNSLYSNMKTAFCPSTGEINYLVIPVYFTDSSEYVSSKTQGKSDIEKAFFGDAKKNGWNSVKSFYETASDGKLTINGKVSDWYEAGRDTSYYGTDDVAINELAMSAVKWYFEENPAENRTDYDYDKNGTLDGVALIYGCPDSSDEWGKDLVNFWGKVIRADLESPDKSAPTLGFFMWMSVNDAYTDTFTGRNEVDSHVFIHETGHFFGLVDYYDYGDNDYRPSGGFITMEHNTGAQDPFSCLALGWAKAIVPQTSCTIELKDFQSGHEVIVLSPSPDSFNSPFGEYVIIELFTPTGLNKFDATYAWCGYYSTGASKAGIRIWHVDSRLVRGTVAGSVVNWSETFYTDPTVGNTEAAFTNSWDREGRISVLGEEYQDYSLLFSVRNDKTTTFRPQGDVLSNDTLFYSGDTFSVSDYSSQFVNGTKLNCGDSLGWSMEIENISRTSLFSSEYTATLNLTFAG